MGTQNCGIRIAASVHNPICIYSDASFINETGRKSTTGIMVLTFSDLVYWKSKSQMNQADSSGIAEYMAIYEAIKSGNGL